MYKKDLALNNLQELICNKTKQTFLKELNLFVCTQMFLSIVI